jgi:hypothetical protein
LAWNGVVTTLLAWAAGSRFIALLLFVRLIRRSPATPASCVRPCFPPTLTDFVNSTLLLAYLHLFLARALRSLPLLTLPHGLLSSSPPLFCLCHLAPLLFESF